MVDPQQLIGRTLGDFVLRELIGEGSFGRVFRAEQPILEREAVVKVSAAEGRDPAQVQAFLTEARLASRLDHPFVAHTYAFGAEPDGTLWIAMELVRGSPMSALIEHGAVEPERAIPLIRRLCEVVHTAHELGIVHRDLKPANVMVISRAGNLFPKLLDLGIARDLRGDPQVGLARGSGTPLYMAPEQWIASTKVDGRADVYALGALTFELLTGAPPFTGRSVLEIAAKHAKLPPPPLPAPHPAALSAAIARALAKRPDERFATALAFGDALIDSSGVAVEAASLPRLDEVTRDEAVLRAPRPIAEAVAELDAATSPGRARAAVHAMADTIARVCGAIALSARDRVGSGRHADAPVVAELLAALRERALTAAEWWRLTRELCRPFGELRDVHPVPELVAVFFDGRAEVRTALDGLLAANDPGPTAAADPLHTYLVGAVPSAAAALRSVGFLGEYRVAVPVDAAGDTTEVEVWTGVRRPEPVRAAVTRPCTGPTLIDARGGLVVELAPYVQVASPAAGAARELFFVDGPARGGGTRMRALPGPLELRADVWRADAAAGTGPAADDVVPYLGLSTFSEADAGLFFGREREVDELVNRLRRTPFVAVVGPSGSGKSSFVRAGVLPALGADERSVVVRPGPTPLATLTARLAALDVALDPAAVRADPAQLGDRLRAWAAAGQRVVLVVDQFEELFTMCFDAAEQEAYAEALHRAARADDPSVRVIVTLRDDFLIRTAGLAALRRELNAQLQLITTPAAPDLLRILTEPARRAGYAFEDDALPREMVDEVAARPGALALLSFTASKLWQVRDRAFRRLTRTAYRALGGVGGALAQHAEAVLAELADADRPIVRELFRHLVTADGTRAVMSRDELLQVAGGDRAGPVLEALITARLLVAMDTGDGERIEVVHETLLVAWPRLVTWRQQDAENARLLDQLRAAARQWHERGRPRGLLWRGEALAEYRLWRARYRGGLTEVEESFGAHSNADALRGRRLRQGALITVLVGLTVALVVFARLRTVAQASERAAVDSRRRAETSEAATAQSLTLSYVDQGRRALVGGAADDALVYLAAAWSRGYDTPASRFMLARALAPLAGEVATLPHAGLVTAVKFLPDGKRVLTGGNGKLRLWTVDGALIAEADAGPPDSRVLIATSRDGTRVVTGSGAGMVQGWDVDPLRPRDRLDGGDAEIVSLDLSPDGARLAASSITGEIRLWTGPAAPAILPIAVPDMLGAFVSISPTAPQVAIQYVGPMHATGTAALWTPGAPPRLLAAPHGGPRAVFDRTGAMVATPGYDGVTRLWRLATGQLIRSFTSDAAVQSTAFADDGATLATGSEDGSVKLWDVASGKILAGLRRHTAGVNAIRFFASSTRLATAGADGVLALWDVQNHGPIGARTHGGLLSALDVSPDETMIATASWAGSAKLWRTESAADAVLLGGPEPRVPAVSPDGRYLIRVGRADTEIWTLADGTRQVTPAASMTWAMEPDHPVVAFAGGGVVRVIDLATAATTRTWPIAGEPVGFAFEVGGARLAVLAADGVLTIYDAATGAPGPSRKLAAAGGVEFGAGFLVVLANGLVTALRADDLTEVATHPTDDITLVRSPDGTYVASMNGAGVDVWSKAGVVTSLSAGGRAATVEWSADRIAIGSADGTVHLWRQGTWASDGELRAFGQAAGALAMRGSLIAALGGVDQVRVFDLETRRELYEVGVNAGALGIWFARDRIVAASPTGPVEVLRAELDLPPRDEVLAIASCRDPARAATLGLPACAAHPTTAPAR